MNVISKPIVAVVDDDPRIRESLESLIESAGLKARVFSLAEDFLDGEILAVTSCLITDVRMPKMDGLELQRRLRIKRPELPVIFITAHHEDQIERCAFAQGAAFFVHKPFDADELLCALKLALRRAQGDDEKTLEKR
ncbi:response regulator [Alloacidobacterium dinghuense]|uniref:Response regulator n=1 Tax=Alloacidobacterium dinghuense TaxID=2763107 RepID=A0A7G8BLI0_9BACT|nr:response regulator [Alloacidobacterium dinghuense]QNI33400.1 response regulator [Alloacidobacterium dinghuense]